jgi:hypothetical protein
MTKKPTMFSANSAFVAYDDAFIALLNRHFPINASRPKLNAWRSQNKFIPTVRFLSRKSPAMLRKADLAEWARKAWGQDPDACLAFERAIGFAQKKKA